MQLFYNAELLEETKNFSFDRDESRHIIKVLRRKIDDILLITNGHGLIFTAVITDSNTKACSVKIVEVKKIAPSKHSLHLIVAPTKMNERYEWFLEKATEIGVQEITPILCDRSERKHVKIERFKKVILSAMKQSSQAYLPKINPLITFKDFLDKPQSNQLFIAHCDDSKRFQLSKQLKLHSDYTIMIGPEGDFSSDEIAKAKEKGFVPVLLGNTRLRTETAAIVACTTVAVVNSQS